MLGKFIGCSTNVHTLANVSYNVTLKGLAYLDNIFRFILYFKMYPERLKYSPNASTPTDLSEHWRLSLKIKSVLKVYSSLLICLVFSLGLMKGFPSGVTTAIAWILGIFSMILSVFQFVPQIHQTFKHKVSS